ncbi:histidine kinase [Phormidium willei BDU 130791]|nr:histidine kinase [Phormidium willei BDU 130791]
MTLIIKHLNQRWFRLPLRVRGTLIVSIPISCLFITLSTLAWLKLNLIEDEAWVQHTQTVRLETKYLLNALLDAETGMRGYGLTRQNEFLIRYDYAISTIPDSVDTLENLVDDNAEQTLRIQAIRNQVNDVLDIFEHKLTLQENLTRIQGANDILVPVESLYNWLKEGQDDIIATRDAIERFADEEETLLIERIQHRDRHQQLTFLFLILAATIATLASWSAIHLFYELEQELANRQQTLKDTNERLESVCNQLQRFTANASHELRAPLAVVLSNTQIALMTLKQVEDSPEIAKERLEKVVKTTKQMSQLIGELLFLARHEGLLAPEKRQPIDISQFLLELAKDWTSHCRDKNLSFNTHILEQNIWVEGDENLLRQAVTNLLSNAVRYTPPGGEIELRLEPKHSALIQVKDTGIGIAEAALPHVFERFYCADLKRSKASGGFGLGLAIVEQIIQIHGGTVRVESQLGKGSLFTIALPIV